MKGSKDVVLDFVGIDFWSRPVYRVNGAELFVKDLNLGEGNPEFYWSSPKDDSDGEPDYSFAVKAGVNLIINKPQERVLTREDKKLILATMIDAHQFVDGKNSVEWVDFVSSIHDIELTKELLAELKAHPLKLVWTADHGYVRA